MAKKVTMQQIANYLGVSKFVVSKALSNKEGVSEATKQKVVETAAKLGYFTQRSVDQMNKPYRASSDSLPITKQSMIVLMPNVRFQTKESLYWGKIIDGIANELEHHGIGMMILSEQSIDKLSSVINLDGIMGVIGVGEISTTMLLQIQRLGILMVLVDHEDELIEVDSIFADNFDAIYRLTKQFLNVGKKDIVFVGDIHYSRSFYDRYLGYRTAMEANTYQNQIHSQTIEHSLLTFNGADEAQISEMLPQWFSSLSKLPEVIICANDVIAINVMKLLQEKGVEVPASISITGFDNIDDSFKFGLPLTTVNVPKEILGKKAVDCLLHRKRNIGEPIMKVLIKSEILFRDSTIFFNK